MSFLVTIVSGFAGGVLMRSVFSTGWEVPVFVLVVAALVSAAWFLKGRRAYSLAAVFCLCLVLGIGRAAVACRDGGGYRFGVWDASAGATISRRRWPRLSL